MPADYFVDTNVLVYAFDLADAPKRARAVDVLRRLLHSGNGTVSVQVVQEWLSVALRKRRLRVDRAVALETARRLLSAWDVLSVTPETVSFAVTGVERFQLAPYDATIWATAHLNSVPFVLSEDFSHGQRLEGVTFLDPFRDDFDLEALGALPA